MLCDLDAQNPVVIQRFYLTNSMANGQYYGERPIKVIKFTGIAGVAVASKKMCEQVICDLGTQCPVVVMTEQTI